MPSPRATSIHSAIREDVGRLIVSMHMGLRQTSNLDEPARFLRDLEKSWAILLGAILQPDRLDYFRQFVRRRAALARSRGRDRH